MKFECLKNIVGITNTDCDCILNSLTSEEIESLRISKSGLYTDDLAGGVSLKSLSGVDSCKLFSEIAIDSRNNAIKATEDDLIMALSERYAKNKNKYIGRLGNYAFSKPLETSKIYVGHKLQPHDKSDAVMIIKGLEIAVTTTSNLVLKIIAAPVGASVGETLLDLPIETIAGARKVVTLSEPLKLNFMSNGQSIEYYIVYDKTALNGGQPMNNTISCGCGTEKNLKSFIKFDGIELNNLSDLNTKVLTSWANGISLDVEVRCETANFICREYDENDAVSVALAYAIWYKAGELIIESVMKSTEVSRLVLVSREYLWGKRNHFRAEYEARIKWLVSDKGIDINSTDCFICKQEDGLFYHGIKA